MLNGAPETNMESRKSYSHQFSGCCRLCGGCYQQINCSCRVERMCFMCHKKPLPSFKFWFFLSCAKLFLSETKRKESFCCVTKQASTDGVVEERLRCVLSQNIRRQKIFNTLISLRVYSLSNDFVDEIEYRRNISSTKFEVLESGVDKFRRQIISERTYL